MKNEKIIAVIMLVFFLSGCDELLKTVVPKKKRVKPPEPVSVVQYMDNIDLAKLILKPAPYQLKVTRDPFKPLIEKTDGEALPAAPQMDSDIVRELEEKVKKIKYLGALKMGDEYSALVKTEKKKGVYKVNDSLDEFTIIEIHPDHLVLQKNRFTFKLKRGDK